VQGYFAEGLRGCDSRCLSDWSLIIGLVCPSRWRTWGHPKSLRERKRADRWSPLRESHTARLELDVVFARKEKLRWAWLFSLPFLGSCCIQALGKFNTTWLWMSSAVCFSLLRTENVYLLLPSLWCLQSLPKFLEDLISLGLQRHVLQASGSSCTAAVHLVSNFIWPVLFSKFLSGNFKIVWFFSSHQLDVKAERGVA